MKKFLSICLCLALVIAGGLTLTACGKDKAKVMSEEDFLKAITTATAAEAESHVVKLTGDVTLSKAVSVDKAFTIDLNGHEIKENVTWDDDDRNKEAMFLIKENGKLTVKGSGAVTSDDLYIFWLAGTTKAGTTLTVEGGDYQADCSVVYVTAGTATVTGGTYKIVNDEHPNYVDYMLNIKNDKQATSDIVVKGGTFHGFNPAQLKNGDKSSYVDTANFKSTETKEGSKVWVVTAVAK